MKDIILDYYKRNVGLYDLFPLIVVLPEAMGAATMDEHKKFLEKYAEKSEKKEDHISYNVPIETLGRHLRLIDRKNSYALAQDLLPQSIIVTLVSQFDLFVTLAIKYIYHAKPEMMNAIQRDITYSEINRLGDIEKIKAYLIEKEIETILRDSHHSQICWFEKKLGTTLQADKELIADFVEITQRRNLFVHSDGLVNQQYLSTCKEHGYTCDDIKAGDKLRVDMEYFCHSADRLMEIGCKLSQILKRVTCTFGGAAPQF